MPNEEDLSRPAEAVKLKAEVKDLIKYYSAVLDLNQGTFIEEAVAEYLERHEAAIARAIQAKQAQTKSQLASRRRRIPASQYLAQSEES